VLLAAGFQLLGSDLTHARTFSVSRSGIPASALEYLHATARHFAFCPFTRSMFADID
jgi:hypothetical protein